MSKIYPFLFLFLVACEPASNLKLVFKEPAEQWEESLPLGNGRLGMMPDGGVYSEKIVLNDITLWSGSPQDANNYDASRHLPEIRKLLSQGKNVEAEKIINENFICKGPGSGFGNGQHVQFGCYQVLGELNLDFNYNQINNSKPSIKNYTRELQINEAIANCSYTVNSDNYYREYFTSFENDLGIIMIRSERKGMLNLSLSLSRQENFRLSSDEESVSMTGQLDNGIDGKGMKYKLKVVPKITGGSILIKNDSIKIKGATNCLIYVSAATDYLAVNYESFIDSILSEASSKSYIDLKEKHVASFKTMFDRLSLSIGNKTGSHDDSRIRLLSNQAASGKNDPALAALFFQYGRYLSISSTRPGLLPPNLQGLWANQIQTPWNGDYHLDVNLEMNHWPLDVTNLSELNKPLVTLVKNLLPNGEKTAKAYYNTDGWISHVITNIWGYTEPGEQASWGITKSGSGWLCNNLWEHFEFTSDTMFLNEVYPILKSSANFYKSILISDPNSGYLITSPSSSPENSFYTPDNKVAHICEGPTIDNQIIRELFSNVIRASEILETDPDLRQDLITITGKLAPIGQISGDGRIMEWMMDYKEVDPHHRHISHLYGLYPASLITPEKTPALAEACRKTLEVRGDDGPGWSIAYKILLYARLKDGNKCGELLQSLLRPTSDTRINYGAGGGVYPNLFSAGPPFQIDGNFGGTAAIAEMLIQSHAGFIELLPAIPDSWKKSGEIRGIKARGNIQVDFKWKDGKVTDYHFYSVNQNVHYIEVKVNGKLKKVTLK